MGYTIAIGNAITFFDKDDFPYLFSQWKVEGKTLENAPVFENDEMTGNSNSRSPSYSVWADFCRETGLYKLFLDKEGLMAEHPGCKGITKDDAKFVSNALKKYQATAILPPGFEGFTYEGEPRYDYHLARLIWLEFWMSWAINNCEIPAIQNT